MYLLNANEISQVSGGYDLDRKGEALVNYGFSLLGMSSLGFVGLQIGSVVDRYIDVGRVTLTIQGPAGGIYGLGIGAVAGLVSAAFLASSVIHEMKNSNE